MSEKSEGPISIAEAVERITQDDEAVEIEATEDTGDSTSEEPEVETEGDDTPDDPEVEYDTPEGRQKARLSELIAGNMRNADYTRKTQTLAEERRAAEKLAAEAAQLREQLEESLKMWAVPTEQEPDWEALAQKSTPQEFNLKRAQWDQRQRRKMQAQAEYRALQERVTAERVAQERNKLFEAFPEWRDEQKFLGAAKKMADGGTEYGFTPDEIGTIMDHRMIRVLNDAIAYRELQKGKPAVEKKVAKAEPALKPGSKPSKVTETEVARQKQRARLKQTGSIQDAVELILRR